MTKGEHVYTFSNSSEAGNWRARNCDRCWKASHLKPYNAWESFTPTEYTLSYCALDAALLERPDTIPLTLAKRYGWGPRDGSNHPDCPHREEHRPAKPRRKVSARGMEALL